MSKKLHLDWAEVSRDCDRWCGQAIVPKGLAVLEGHFPNEPIVPGVAQLFWAATEARRVFPDCVLTSELRNLKFSKAILPELRLRLTLLHERGKRRRIAFEYASDAGVHSRGYLLCR